MRLTGVQWPDEMTNKSLFLALLIPQVAIVAAPAQDMKASDDYINDAVKQKLAADTVVKGGNLEVEVKNGVVTISGKVQEMRQKSKAESLAKKTHGVKSVINNIKIEKP
jgi:osmotically-inducible protein OsmY